MISKVKGSGRRSTFKVNAPFSNKSWHVKLRPSADYSSLQYEVERLQWLSGKISTPSGATAVRLPITSLLVTETINGLPTHKLINKIHPSKIIDSLVEAVELLHKTDVTDFPFSGTGNLSQETVEGLLSNLASMREQENKTLHPDYDNMSMHQLRSIISNEPTPPQEMVAVHGDLCMPNLLFSGEGEFKGVIDVGLLHLGDPLYDIALLSWCLEANMGIKWANKFLSRYGLARDAPAIQYYRLAYDLSLTHLNPWKWVMKESLIRQRKELAKIKEAL